MKLGKLLPAIGVAFALATTGTAALALESSAITELNVRSGPGNTHRVIGQLRAGQRVEVERCATNGWCFVQSRNVEGWAFSKYLTAEDDGGGFDDVDIADDDEDFFYDEEEDYYDDFYGDPFHQRFGLFFGPGRWR